MGMGSAGRGRMVAEINVTPLVDVMLVLLIIFMVTTPLMNSQGVAVQLPTAQGAALRDADDPERVVISLTADGRVPVGDADIPEEALSDHLTKLARGGADRPGLGRADGDVPYRDLARILGLARAAGMLKVGLVFEPMGGADAPEAATPP